MNQQGRNQGRHEDQGQRSRSGSNYGDWSSNRPQGQEGRYQEQFQGGGQGSHMGGYQGGSQSGYQGGSQGGYQGGYQGGMGQQHFGGSHENGGHQGGYGSQGGYQGGAQGLYGEHGGNGGQQYGSGYSGSYGHNYPGAGSGYGGQPMQGQQGSYGGGYGGLGNQGGMGSGHSGYGNQGGMSGSYGGSYGGMGGGQGGMSGMGGSSGQGGHQGHFDPDYHQWREEQMRNLDNDYHSWRQDRYKKFSDEFSQWRSQRPKQGSSGSGKSTLARLLMRLYEPDAGRISIGGQALGELTLQSLRDAIGLVPQEPLLFNDSIAYNIAYGRPEASREEVEAAARAAQADAFIQLLPEGYETVVGERGARLSGGERQRIAIARALLKNPPIMVLDEATSALDTRSERAIQAALDQAARHRTALIIAHRLSTIVDADQIVVMDRGRIVEQGPHAELLARGGLYAQLWALQRQEEQAQTLARRLSQHPVNLAGLLILALDSLHAQLDAQRTELFTSIDMTVARVMGDASQVARIVQLVCEQALQAAAGGRMEARLAREALSSRLTLSSHGRPAASDPPESPAPDTLELRTLVDEAGGRLLLRRDSPFELVVQVAFPLPVLAADLPRPPSLARAADAAPAEGSARPDADAGLGGMRLLCVDDDEDALASLAALLEAEGAQVEAVSSGREALQRLSARDSAHWPDALLCDIVLGQEDGHAVARSIRSLEALRETPLSQRLPAVALTGMAQPEDRLRALAAGFQRHLAKPVMPQELVRVLRQLVPSKA